MSLEEQTNRAGPGEILCIGQKRVERRAGAGGDDIEGLGRHRFHPLLANFCIQPQSVADGFQELAFLARGFEQRDLDAVTQEDREDEAGKSRAAAKISQRFRSLRHIADELGAVPDMSLPDIGEGRRGHEIVARVPILEHPDIGFQARKYFT